MACQLMVSRGTYPIFENMYTRNGTTGESSFPYIMTPICFSLRRKYLVFRASCMIRFLPKYEINDTTC